MTSLLSSHCPLLSEAESVQVVSVALTNSFEMTLPGVEGRMLFDKISRINHSCVANMLHTNIMEESEKESILQFHIRYTI